MTNRKPYSIYSALALAIRQMPLLGTDDMDKEIRKNQQAKRDKENQDEVTRLRDQTISNSTGLDRIDQNLREINDNIKEILKILKQR